MSEREGPGNPAREGLHCLGFPAPPPTHQVTGACGTQKSMQQRPALPGLSREEGAGDGCGATLRDRVPGPPPLSSLRTLVREPSTHRSGFPVLDASQNDTQSCSQVGKHHLDSPSRTDFILSPFLTGASGECCFMVRQGSCAVGCVPSPF